MECMPQFEAQIPDPLRKNEPEFLAPGRMRAPAVRVLFLILISEHGLKSPAMQVEGHDISRSKCLLWQGGVEQFVDRLATRGADFRRGFSRWMCGDDHSCARSRRGQEEIRTIKEGAAGSSLGMSGLLVWALGKTGLHLLQIEEIVVLAAHDVA